MSDKETDKELSMDELKDVSGGIRTQGGGYKAKGKEMKSVDGIIEFQDEGVDLNSIHGDEGDLNLVRGHLDY